MRIAIDSIDAALDAALVMTFPASDPVALFMPDHGGGPVAADQSDPAINEIRFPLSHGQR